MFSYRDETSDRQAGWEGGGPTDRKKGFRVEVVNAAEVENTGAGVRQEPWRSVGEGRRVFGNFGKDLVSSALPDTTESLESYSLEIYFVC